MATILVADDNSNIQKMVTLAFKDQGINVIAVGNGEAAVRKLPDALPDLVLADIFMPVRSGYEVCEFVKQDPRFAHIPVVLLVGAFDPLDEREAQRVGADGVLKKPFVPPEPLITMVKSLLGKAARERVPVAAAVGPSHESPALAPEAALPEPVAELVPEEFPPLPPPARLEFNKHEIPLAFGELLETPATEAEPKPEVARPRDTGLGEWRFWTSPAAAEQAPAESESAGWGVIETAPPAHEEPTPPSPPEGERPEPGRLPIEEPVPAAEAAASPGQDFFAPAGPGTEKVAEKSAHAALAEEPPALEEAEEAPELGEFVSETQVEAAPPEPGGWELAADQVAEPPAEARASAAGPPAAETWQAPLPPPPETSRSEAVRTFGVPRPPDPQLVEAVVARVIERMQPQIVDIVTREILKPVVEALVRRELEKR